MAYVPPADAPPAIVMPAVPSVPGGSPVVGKAGGSVDPSPAGLDLESAPVPDVVRALCLATDHLRFVLSPDIVTMGSKLTLALLGSKADVWRDGLSALDLAGVASSCNKAGLCRFFVAPVVAAVKADIPTAVFSYEPQHRDVAFLGSALAGMFPGWHFAGANGQAAPGGGAVATVAAGGGSGGGGPASGHAEPAQSVPVRLVGVGPSPERSKVKAALVELDRDVPALTVRVAVYEVDTSVSTPYAMALVANVLGSQITVGASVPTTLAAGAAGGALTIKAGSFAAVVGALDSTSNAHLVTAPTLRTSSGVIASFAVGDSVPTVGSVSYAQGSSTPIQSVQYQQSGVVFSVVPELVGGMVDVALYQSVSQFIATTAGVTSSPTLQNRALSSDVIVVPGQTVVLGGLMQSNDSKGSAGWWVLPALAHQSSQSKSELVLVLSVEVER